MIQAATLEQQKQLQAQRVQGTVRGGIPGKSGPPGVLQISSEMYEPIYGVS